MYVYLSRVQSTFIGWQRVDRWTDRPEWLDQPGAEPTLAQAYDMARAAATFVYHRSDTPFVAYFSAMPLGPDYYPFLFAFHYPQYGRFGLTVFVSATSLWHAIEWEQYVKLRGKPGRFSIEKNNGKAPSEWPADPFGGTPDDAD